MTQEQLVYYAKKIQEEWSLEQLIEKVFLNNNEVGSPTTQTDAQHAKNLMSGALDGTDAADRLRWLLSQAERVVTVDAEDRKAVERACKLLKDIDNGFDAVRG